MAGGGAQRKAWNETMGLSHSGMTQRRSGRHQKKQSRHQKARKDTSSSGGDGGWELVEYRNAVHMDSLEGILGDGMEEEDHQEEYDELEELDNNNKNNNNNNNNKSNKKKKKGSSTRAKPKNKKASSSSAKRWKPRSLASILMEESGRSSDDGIVSKYIHAEATLPKHTYPTRKFCPVTGLFGRYTDAKTGIPYATLEALEQIQERAPPWMNLGGSATYMETIKTLKNED